MTAPNWSLAFDSPIALPDGRQLRTLRHVAAYIQQELTPAAQKRPERQTATRILIGVAEGKDILMHAEIAMRRAIGNCRPS